MRNNLARLAAFTTFPSFDTSGGAGGGGGTAVAAPPAPSAASPASPAAPAPTSPAAPAKPAGVFGNLSAPTIALPPEPAKPGAAAATPPGTPAAPGQPGAAGQPPATPAAPTITADTPFAQPLLGRFKTPKEAEEALRRSQDEGLRLHEETKTSKAAAEKLKADYVGIVKELTAQLELARTTTPFKEMGKEDLDKLRKEDPASYADYLRAKDAHDREVQGKKDQIENQTKEREREYAETLRTIKERDGEMRADPESYPQYVELLPVMNQLADLTKVGEYSPLTGHPWSGEILHLAALGHAYKQALKAAKGASTTAAAAAGATAAAAATATTAPPSGGSGGGSGAAGDDAAKEHQAWKDSVLKHAPKSLFGGAK